VCVPRTAANVVDITFPAEDRERRMPEATRMRSENPKICFYAMSTFSVRIYRAMTCTFEKKSDKTSGAASSSSVEHAANCKF
jgi:hypothetical protein